MSMLRVAAVVASRYIINMLSLPPLGELENICALWVPTAGSVGKNSAPCSTLPVVLLQLSSITLSICATTGPSTR